MAHLKAISSLCNIPLHLPLFDKKSGQDIKKSSIILSSYETFAERTTWAEEQILEDYSSEDVSFKIWRTRLEGCFSVVALDEGHRAENRDTRTHASISLLKVASQPLIVWVISATPMQNSETVSLPTSAFHTRLLTTRFVGHTWIDRAALPDHTRESQRVVSGR